jgi:hypothetical protein
MTHTLAATVVQFFSYKSKRAIKNRGTEFSFSSVPTVGVSLQLLATHHGVGGDPLEMGTTRPWAKTKRSAEIFPVASMMGFITRSQGIAWPQ